MSPPSPRPDPAGWRWPPPGARATVLRVREAGGPGGVLTYDLAGPQPDRRDLRALLWLLDEHPREAEPHPAEGSPREVRLGIARRELGSGRVGTRFALEDEPLGAPGRAAERGLLWRWIHATLGTPPA